jgi:hypothetical protein
MKMSKSQKSKIVKAKFVQIASVNNGKQIDLFALDAEGNVWKLKPYRDPELVEKSFWVLLSNRRVISPILQDLFNIRISSEKASKNN